VARNEPLSSSLTDVYPPDEYPPDVYPPDVYPPDVYPPDVYPPDVYPPDVYPPDVYPPALVWLPMGSPRGREAASKSSPGNYCISYRS
jgi:hypothetical protein